MKVRVDPDRCQGHTLCKRYAPAIFALREEDGHSYVVVSEVPPEHEEATRRAVQGCPEGAISIERPKA